MNKFSRTFCCTVIDTNMLSCVNIEVSTLAWNMMQTQMNRMDCSLDVLFDIAVFLSTAKADHAQRYANVDEK